MMLRAEVHPADVQDHDGAVVVLREVRRMFPFIEKVIADGAYRGAATATTVRALGAWCLEIVKRFDTPPRASR